MTGFGADAGASLGASAGNGTGAVRWPQPAWKQGTNPIQDRGGL